MNRTEQFAKKGRLFGNKPKLGLITLLILSLLLFTVFPLASCNKPEGKPIKCTVEIRCDNLLKDDAKINSQLKKLVPKDGIILKEVQIKTTDTTSVVSTTKALCKKKKIAFVFKGNEDDDTAYVQGIAGIFEKDAGKTSGWMYKVNGKSPTESGGEHLCKEGDKIIWGYVTSYKDKI